MSDADMLIGFFNLYDGQLNLYQLCKLAGIKTIASNHENFFYPYTNYDLEVVARRRMNVYKELDANIWPLNFSAFVSGLSNKNSYVMPNPNAYKSLENAHIDKRKVIICVGRFNDYIKRIDRILAAFKLIQDRVPESKLMLVGDCDRQVKNTKLNNKSVNDLISELGIDENNIMFIGRVNNVEDYYNQSSVLMLASDSEGFSMVINEAACFGVPTVANYIPGLEDLITNGSNGFLVDQGNTSLLADKVSQILEQDNLRDKLSKKALLMSERFNADKVGEMWRFLIDTTLQETDQEVLRNKLSTKLSYNTNNHKIFCKLLLDEIDKINSKHIDDVSKLNEELKRLKHTTGIRKIYGIKIALVALKRMALHARRNGLINTMLKILKKLYKLRIKK